MPEPSEPHMQLLNLLQQYITLYGKGLISVILYPEVSREKLKIYLDSLRITLKRYGKAPVYLWQHEPDLSRYRLILFTNACFTHDMSEILPVITRLWQNQSDIPFQIQSWTIVDTSSLDLAAQELSSLGWQTRSQNAGWHQRMFGASHV